MKTFFKLFLILSIFFLNIKISFSKDDIIEVKPKNINYMSEGIFEQITPKFKNKKIKEINSTIIIPENYQEEEIIITPQIFSSIREYTYFKNKYDIDINITIKNNSSYNYSYLDNSYILQTDDVRRYGIDENFDFFYNYKGFDDRKILTSYTYKLNNNDAVKSLTKKRLNKLLQNESLSKYYLKFYNKKYNLDKNNLSEFDINIIDEIFSGKLLGQKVVEQDLVELSYNYFYNKDLTINDKPIASYMENINNLEKFNVTSKTDYQINPLKLKTSKLYYYPIDVYMEFRLRKGLNAK